MPVTTAFRHAWPLLAVTLVNKVASTGLSLLPALLVAREVGVTAAAAAMGLARGTAMIGTLVGGALSDQVGLRATLLTSFTLAGIGVATMTVDGPLALLVGGAMTAQLGMAMFPAASRMMLAATVPVDSQREAIAWLRSTANFGLVISFSVGALLGGGHIGWLLAMDAAASLSAAALASVVLPIAEVPRSPTASSDGADWWSFGWMTLIVACWNFTYEAFLTSTAAQLTATLGEDGVSWFSGVMVLNTVVCSLLGVAAARWIDSPRSSVPLGFALLAAGAVLAASAPGWPLVTAAGMAIVTAGELLFSATAQFVWMALVPAGPRRGTVFSASMTVAFGLKALGGALAFPLIVHGSWPGLGMLAIALPGLLAAWSATSVWRSFQAVGAVR